jgi:chromosomal replication initiation ATPase DnaA
VNFVENLRFRGAKLILLSGVDIEELGCDAHVRSRLLPGGGHSLGPPAPEDMGVLVRLLAKQRGLLLSDRQVGYLSSRLRRDCGFVEEYLERVAHLQRVLNSPIKLPLLSDAIIEEGVYREDPRRPGAPDGPGRA